MRRPGVRRWTPCLLVTPLLLLAACGSDADSVTTATTDPTSTPTEQAAAAPEGSELDLVEGAQVGRSGFTGQGEDGPRVAMDVAFVSVDCAARLDDADTDEFGAPVAMTAPEGQKLCLVELAVTNADEVSGWYAADLDAVLVTGSGEQFPPAESGYDPQLLADNAGQPYSAGVTEISPAGTAHDFVVFSVDESAEPAALTFPTAG